MKRFFALIFILALALVSLHLSAMRMMPAFFHDSSMIGTGMEMPDCPMGFICPMHFESSQAISGAAVPKIFMSGLAVIAVVFLGYLGFAIGSGYSPPRLVFANTGPPIARYTVKRE